MTTSLCLQFWSGWSLGPPCFFSFLLRVGWHYHEFNSFFFFFLFFLLLCSLISNISVLGWIWSVETVFFLSSANVPHPYISPLYLTRFIPQSWFPRRSEVLLLCGGGMGRGVWAGGLWCSRLGLGTPPPSLSVLDEDGGGGGGIRGRGADEGGILVDADPILLPDLRLWILRHSWQILTWVQLRAGSITGVGAGGGGVVLAPSGSSRILWGPGPRSGCPVPPAPPPAPPVRGPAPLYSLPLLSRISRTRRRGRGAPRAMRVGWRKAAELLRGRLRRIRELFLQETAFRNSVIISWQTDT